MTKTNKAAFCLETGAYTTCHNNDNFAIKGKSEYTKEKIMKNQGSQTRVLF